MLHQFLSAETIQVPEESVLFIFLGGLFLSHNCTVLDLQPDVNLTPGVKSRDKGSRATVNRAIASGSSILLPRLSAIGNAKSLANRYGGVLEIREVRNQFQVVGDLLRMGENVIGDQ